MGTLGSETCTFHRPHSVNQGEPKPNVKGTPESPVQRLEEAEMYRQKAGAASGQCQPIRSSYGVCDNIKYLHTLLYFSYKCIYLK